MNGTKLSGCFNTLNIAEGETVDLVVEYNDDNTEGVVYAIRKPQQRCLWIAPMMEIGHGAAKHIALFLPLAILKYFLPVCFIILFLGLSFLFDKFLLKEVFISTLRRGEIAYLLLVINTYVNGRQQTVLNLQILNGTIYLNTH